MPSSFSSFSSRTSISSPSLTVVDVLELDGGDDALALVADVDEDFLGTDFDDGAFDDFARRQSVWCFASGLLPW